MGRATFLTAVKLMVALQIVFLYLLLECHTFEPNQPPQSLHFIRLEKTPVQLARFFPECLAAMILSRLVDTFSSRILYLCCLFQGIIVLLSFDHRRKPAISRAYPPVIPVVDKIPPDDSPAFIRGHFFYVITLIQ